MSTRQTKLLIGPIHVFFDVVGKRIGDDRIVGRGYFVDIGRASYNRAWKIWPPTLRRLY